MAITDSISLLFSDNIVDVVSGQAATIAGSDAVIVLDTEVGSGISLKANQIISIINNNVFSKISTDKKGTISFWNRAPQLGANQSVPIMGIGTQNYQANLAIPVTGMVYFYQKSDEDGLMRFYVSMHDASNSIQTFSYGPIEPLILTSYIFTFSLQDNQIISLYVDGSVVDLVPESESTVVPSSLKHASNHYLIVNKFSSSLINDLKSGAFDIADAMIYSDFISDIADIASIINNGGFDFLRRKTGQMQGTLPSILPPAIAAAFSKGRINDSVASNFGIVAGTEDGSVLLGMEKAWQRRISFGDPLEFEKIVFSKTSNDFEAEIDPGGFLKVRGANFRIF